MFHERVGPEIGRLLTARAPIESLHDEEARIRRVGKFYTTREAFETQEVMCFGRASEIKFLLDNGRLEKSDADELRFISADIFG
eukprot:13143900-Alexandrium_andersonii.AAC.1